MKLSNFIALGLGSAAFSASPLSMPTQINNINFLNSFQYTCEHKEEYSFVEDDDLTSMCMSISEKSLSEDWDNEDDERWQRFLKD